MIDQNIKDRYWTDGWVVIENVFSRQDAEELAQKAKEVSEAELRESDAIQYTADLAEDGRKAPRKIDRPFSKDPLFRTFVIESQLHDMLEQLLGKPALLVTDQIFMKPPFFGSAKPYHQDNAYFLCEPADGLITAWIALDDVDEENGCLRYIDGSHRGPILPHEPFEGMAHHLAPAAHLIDLQKERLAPVIKGGVVFHHGQTLHTSHRNNSPRWRRAYATHWVTRDVTSETDLLDDAHFLTPEYRRLMRSPAARSEEPGSTFKAPH